MMKPKRIKKRSKATDKKFFTLKELIRSLWFSSDAACLRMCDVLTLAKIAKKIRTYEVTAHLIDCNLKRIVIPIYIQTRRYFADLTTGTLYDRKTGLCFSSSFIYLDLSSLKEIKKGSK